MNSITANSVRRVIAGHFGVKIDCIVDETHLRDDLGADWLDRLELLIMIEDRLADFQIANVVADQIQTVGDLVRVVEDLARLEPGQTLIVPETCAH